MEEPSNIEQKVQARHLPLDCSGAGCDAVRVGDVHAFDDEPVPMLSLKCLRTHACSDGLEVFVVHTFRNSWG